MFSLSFPIFFFGGGGGLYFAVSLDGYLKVFFVISNLKSMSCLSSVSICCCRLVSTDKCCCGSGVLCLKVSVKENEVPTEKNSSRASIFATKASYISN